LFVLAAVLIPSLAGLLAIAGLLIHQERLVVDWQRGSIRFQQPPVYVEEPGHEVTGHRYLFDETLGWRNIPGWRGVTGGKELAINSKGLRDRDYAYRKPPGVKRILVLGDSYTWGYGVRNDEVYTEVLERRFEQEGRKWEVINSGVSGYGTDQEYLWFRTEGVKYQPDLVVVAFFVLNDPRNNTSAVQYGLGKPVFLDTNLSRLRPAELRPHKMQETVPGLDDLDMSIALLRAIGEECRRIGARLLVMKFGFHGEKESRASLAFDRDFAAAIEQQVDGAVLFDLDAECRRRKLSFFKMVEGNIDGHWNAYGHKEVADMLYDFIVPRRAELLGENGSGD